MRNTGIEKQHSNPHKTSNIYNTRKALNSLQSEFYSDTKQVERSVGVEIFTFCSSLTWIIPLGLHELMEDAGSETQSELVMLLRRNLCGRPSWGFYQLKRKADLATSTRLSTSTTFQT